MLLFTLFQNNPALVIPWLFALLIAITIHEFAHGYVAYRLGDDTASSMGRLSLNPIAHLDLMGSVLLVLVGFGWAKPVPINLAKISKGNWGKFLVSVAGIASNILIAIFAAIMLKIMIAFGLTELNLLFQFLIFLIYINVALFIFNLIPIAPLDGYRMFETFAPRAFEKVAPFIEQWGFFILIAVVFMTPIIGNLIRFAMGLFSMMFNLPL
jgi:Zn-dependent protease